MRKIDTKKEKEVVIEKEKKMMKKNSIIEDINPKELIEIKRNK